MDARVTAIGTVLLVLIGAATYLRLTGRDTRLWAWLKRWRFRWPAFVLPSAQPQETDLKPVLRRVHERPVELRQFVANRLADLPLRQHEIDMLTNVMWWAIYNPVEGFLTGNDAVDIREKPERRDNTQRWYMPLPMVGAYPKGLESDETLETLTECHKRLIRLIAEVRFDEPYWMSRSDTRRYS